MIDDLRPPRRWRVKLTICDYLGKQPAVDERENDSISDIRQSTIVTRQSSIDIRQFLGLLLLLPCLLTAQPIDWARVHTLTIQGIDRLYDLKIDEAENTFDEVIRIAPDAPDHSLSFRTTCISARLTEEKVDSESLLARVIGTKRDSESRLSKNVRIEQRRVRNDGRSAG